MTKFCKFFYTNITVIKFVIKYIILELFFLKNSRAVFLSLVKLKLDFDFSTIKPHFSFKLFPYNLFSLLI